MELEIRPGTKSDMPSVMGLIKALALYEKAPEEVETTVDRLVEDGFGENPAFETLVAVYENDVIGFALYYTGYSTWKGKTLYLEDFLISEAYRGRGFGKVLFEAIIQTAKERDMQRMDWQVLDWNEPAIKFYERYNAELDGEWINGRFYKKDLLKFV